jgi:hypothetical protein
LLGESGKSDGERSKVYYYSSTDSSWRKGQDTFRAFVGVAIESRIARGVFIDRTNSRISTRNTVRLQLTDVAALPKAGLQVADGVFSDDEEEEQEVAAAKQSAGAASNSRKMTKADKKGVMLQEVENNLRADWKRHWKAYQEQAAKIQWRTVPGVVVPKDERELIWKDLWGADMGSCESIFSRWILMVVSSDTSPKWHWLQRA